MIRKLMVASLVVSVSVISAFALTGREIIDRSEKLAKPSSTQSKVTMRIRNGSNVEEKEFILYQKTVDGNDMVRIDFTRPTKIKVLTHTHQDGDDEQWFCSSKGKIKKIVGGEKSDSFAQSHMTYEDLESRDVDNYDYNNIGEGNVNGDACYKVEARKKTGTKTYEKFILYVRKSDYFIVRIDFYQKGKLFKYLENKNIRTINGIITPLLITVTMAEADALTELKVEKIVYNANVADSLFSKDNLH